MSLRDDQKFMHEMIRIVNIRQNRKLIKLLFRWRSSLARTRPSSHTHTQIKQFIYSHLVRDLTNYVVSEGEVDKEKAKEIVKSSIKWEGDVKMQHIATKEYEEQDYFKLRERRREHTQKITHNR